MKKGWEKVVSIKLTRKVVWASDRALKLLVTRWKAAWQVDYLTLLAKHPQQNADALEGLRDAHAALLSFTTTRSVVQIRGSIRLLVQALLAMDNSMLRVRHTVMAWLAQMAHSAEVRPTDI